MTDLRIVASRLSLIAGAVCLGALVVQIAGGTDTVKSFDVKPGGIQAFLSSLVYAPSLVLQSTFLTLAGLFTGFIPQSMKTDLFIHFESSKAKAGVLANIGPHGSRFSGAKAGIVIASPSKVDPDYVYTWTRDAALVYKALIDEYTRGEDLSLRTTIDDFVSSQAALQHVSNPSGTILTGGLAEPKFQVDMKPFLNSWGRPQRDGPALRAIALISYANWLVDTSNASYVVSNIWPVVKLDLDYVALSWNLTGFDLWEEVFSSSYFTAAAQHRALKEGAALAERIDHKAAVSLYDLESDNILCYMQSFWNPDKGYMTANTGGGRSGIDSNTILASIHLFDPEAGCDPLTLQPCSDRALSNLKVLVDSFRSIYKINEGIPLNDAVAIGRYAEDVYYNGNPWYLTTAAVAEQLYDALNVWKKQGYLEVTPVSIKFFRQFIPEIIPGTYNSDTSTFDTLTTAVREFADGFIGIIMKYTPFDGSLAEQYTRDEGTPISAKDLTWSYAAILTMFTARKGIVPPSWGAKELLLELPHVCQMGDQRDNGAVWVTFKVTAETAPGEKLYLTGSVPELQSWSIDNAMGLSADNYPEWTIKVNIPPTSQVQYRYFKKSSEGVVQQQGEVQYSLIVPDSGDLTLTNVWA